MTQQQQIPELTLDTLTTTVKNCKRLSQTNIIKMHTCRKSIKLICISILLTCNAISLTQSILVQPYSYTLDDSTDGLDLQASRQHNEQQGGLESLAELLLSSSASGNSLRSGRALAQPNTDTEEQQPNVESSISGELAELLAERQQQVPSQSVGEAMADLLASAAGLNDNQQQTTGASDSRQQQNDQAPIVSTRNSIVEIDTTRRQSNSQSSASNHHQQQQQQLVAKQDMRESNQWYNPKEIIPTLKIATMGKFEWLN